MRGRALSVFLVLSSLAIVAAVGVGAYVTGGTAEVFGLAATPSPSPRPAPTTTSTSTTTTTTTTRPVVTDTIDPAVKAVLLGDTEVLKPGTSSGAVLAVEKRLQQLRYDIAAPDTEYDEETVYAVMAFQKVNDLTRDGVAGPITRQALTQDAKKIEPLASGAPPSRVEVDMTQQIMRLYVDGELTRLITVSTGSGQWFTVEEELRVSIAVTNAGAFEIGRKHPDWEEGPLGSLYKPMYFDGGIAIHGYPTVPPYPASHGCVRVPMHTADWLYPLLPTGFPVHVFGESPAAETERPPDPTRPPETDTVPSSVTDTAPPDDGEEPPATSTSTPTSTTTEPPPSTTTTTTTEPPAPPPDDTEPTE